MIETGTSFGPVAGNPPAGRSARSVAWHALAAAGMFLTPLAMFVPAALINAGLRNGWKGIVLALAGATSLLAAVVALATGGSPNWLPAVFRLVLEVGLPSLVAFELVRRRARFGVVLLAAVLAGVAGQAANEVVLRAVAGQSPYEAVVANFRSETEKTLAAQTQLPEEARQMMSRVAETIASTFMPFILTTVTILMFVLSLVMVTRLPAGRELGQLYYLRYLVLPEALLFAFILGGLSPLMSGMVRTVGLNLLAVVCVLYALQGLAVIRFWVVRTRMGATGTVLLLLTLGLLTLYGIAPVLLFLLGLFDPFFDFRKLNRKEAPNEGHSD